MRQPFIVRARVRTLITADGLMAVQAGTTLGTSCLVDLNSKQEVTMINQETMTPHSKALVRDAMDGGWWPFECLEVLP